MKSVGQSKKWGLSDRLNNPTAIDTVASSSGRVSV
jgi:hypothetical protein